ncbi:MAG TPA: hypothetical protein DCE56_04380 [Cyanobacteria bacterium UBA8553]|nr:hypothetical protein [Cyanobacteria bacterium UBA8553]
MNAQVNSTLPQQNQPTSVGIAIITSLAGILGGIASIIAAIKSSKQAEIVKEERVKIQQDLLSSLDSEEKIQQCQPKDD